MSPLFHHILYNLNDMHHVELNRETTRNTKFRLKLYTRLTSDLPVNCISAVILVTICTGTPRLPEHQKSRLANMD